MHTGPLAAAHTAGRASRRTFLGWLTGGSLVTISALALGQLARFLSFEATGAQPTTTTLGKPAGYARGSVVYAAAARAYIGHDDRGLYALDAGCTHLGCLVEQRKDGGFACPCHGSQFGADGQVQKGPATQALRYLALQLGEDGQIVLDQSRQVDPATRLALPS